MLKLYLDTSTIVKRYVTETDTQTVDIIFDKAEAGELTIAFSLWNIGEALGVLDERRRRKWLTQEEFAQTLKNLADELLKLMRLRTLETILIHTPILTETWNLILNYHIYEADALQITTCIHSQSNALISSDKKLVEASRKTGLKAFHVTKDEEKIKALIKL
ncbi:MAG: type II toxin-antitoxin system VapC family toxin [Candidatus Bathyarchaeia archaeon]|nr:type II toxin-antitoxin system VapC family toxin [Candidatus Bathyarchaeia archaeon]